MFLVVPFLSSQQTDGHRELSINKNIGMVAALRESVATADAHSYEKIATNGYNALNAGFFPAYPLLVSLFHTEFYITGTIISNLLFLACLVLLFRLATSSGLSVEESRAAVLYLTIFPVSYFFSMPFTESLFLCLTLGSVLAAKKDYWWLAGLLGYLSTATRITGILILPCLAIIYWKRKRIQINVLSLALVPLGLLSFMFYVWRITGNLFGVISAQGASGRNTSGEFFLLPLIGFILHPKGFSGWDFEPLSFVIAVLVLLCVCILSKWREWPLAAYCLLSVAMPLSTGTLTSIPRYISVAFPIYFVLAKIGHEKTITFAFTTLLALLTVLCALHYTFAVC